MNWFTRLFRRGRLEQELDEELNAHLRMAAADRMERGEAPSEASINARREFGNRTIAGEATRETWGWTRLDRLLQDGRYALRQMRRNPGFAAVAILSLALGIGANTAIFSILNALLLRSLPVENSQELFLVRKEAGPGIPQRFSYPVFERLRDAGSGAASVAAMTRNMQSQVVTSQAGQPEIAAVQLVSGEFFQTLGARASIGRTIGTLDNVRLGGHPVAVLSYDYWDRHFGRAPDVLGRTVRVNGAPLSIIGVGPPGFRGMWVEVPTDIWVPIAMQTDVHYAQNYSGTNSSNAEQPWVPQRGISWLDVVVRASPGDAVHVREALNTSYMQELASIAPTVAEKSRRALLEQRITLEPVNRGLSELRRRFSGPLFALMALVALVLLIACANTANLLIARAENRRREIAVRLSIGASRGRLIQQLLTESLLLAAIAAGLGFLIARWSSDLLIRSALGIENGPAPFSGALDTGVLLYTAGLSVLTGLLFGLAPAVQASREQANTAMNGASRGIAGPSRSTGAKFLVAAQIALSLLVITGAGLFARSLHNLSSLHLGFDRERVLTVSIDPRAAGFKMEQLPSLYTRLVNRIQEIPGVQSAVVSMCGLAVECRSTTDSILFSGYEPKPGEFLQYNIAGPGYFSTVGIPIKAGREFDAHDSGPEMRAIVVNETLAARYFPGRSAIGQHGKTTVPGPNGPREVTLEVIGVVEDARVNSVREAPAPMAWLPLAGESGRVYAKAVEVRTVGEPAAVTSAVRAAVIQVAPNLPVSRITMLARQVDRSLDQERLISVLATIFGTLALGLACFGLYGVVTYGVSRRIPELGVRMALGATPAGITRTVLRGALSLVALGLPIGWLGTWMASGAIAPLLYGVKSGDGITVAVATLLLVAVAILAALLPARRAAKIDPVSVLRNG